MGETTSLKEIFITLKKRVLFIISITAAATVLSGVISFYALTPVYQNSTQILVNQSNSEQKEVQYNEVQTNLQLINTYNVIIKSPVILDDVIKEMNLSMSSGELNEKITVSSEQDSQVVNITVKDENAELAADIANNVASVFKDKVTSIMNVDNVSILSKAEISANPSPVEPRPMLNIAIAFVVGLMGGIALAFLLEYLDNTIKSEDQLESLLDIPILGTVSTIENRLNANKHVNGIQSDKGGSGRFGA
ncbi:Wzz/FepE/Etk N-terminal domain-containing protein [Bacillus atrophaeus]|uniref:YveK family protein n=1 Tax=Bacillus atrophaeus TaxID=1452 RepID=UPI00227DD264|nr:YveK family protein [Bacillus atrophaeus]MCY9106259.1 Wzz/FepE/Etk N-terminal domain-containing protein [Bacillus atrophaeus]